MRHRHLLQSATLFLIVFSVPNLFGMEKPNSSSGKCSTEPDNPVCQLVNAVCGRLTECFSNAAPQEICSNGLLQSRLLNEAFGVPGEMNTETLGEAVGKLDDGAYGINEEGHFTGCLKEIASLSCEGMGVGYQPIRSTDFENVQNLVTDGSACGKNFSLSAAN